MKDVRLNFFTMSTSFRSKYLLCACGSPAKVPKQRVKSVIMSASFLHFVLMFSFVVHKTSLFSWLTLPQLEHDIQPRLIAMAKLSIYTFLLLVYCVIIYRKDSLCSNLYVEDNFFPYLRASTTIWSHSLFEVEVIRQSRIWTVKMFDSRF